MNLYLSAIFHRFGHSTIIRGEIHHREKEIPFLPPTVTPLDQNAMQLQGNWHFEKGPGCRHTLMFTVVGPWAAIYLFAHKSLWDERQGWHPLLKGIAGNVEEAVWGEMGGCQRYYLWNSLHGRIKGCRRMNVSLKTGLMFLSIIQHSFQHSTGDSRVR